MSADSLTVLVVDDEPLARNRLSTLCERVSYIGQILVADGGEEALRQIERYQPDVLLLDVDMPDLSGMDVANQCLGWENPPQIIFTTAHSKYAVDAFRLDATDYLLKPVKANLLKEALDRVVTQNFGRADNDSDNDYRIWVRDGESSIQIQAANIERIEADRDYMRLCLQERNFLVHESMRSLEEKLPVSMFVRVHRSTILRRDFIREIRRKGRRHFAVLNDDREVSIGPRFIDSVTAGLQYQQGGLGKSDVVTE